MKKELVLPFLISSLIVLASVSCSEESGPSEAAVYVPQIENFWEEENNPTHTFIISTDDDGLSRGIITGTEEYPDSNYFNIELVGFFINREIEFNVPRPWGRAKFKGTIIDDNRIELSSVSGKLTLVR